MGVSTAIVTVPLSAGLLAITAYDLTRDNEENMVRISTSLPVELLEGAQNIPIVIKQDKPDRERLELTLAVSTSELSKTNTTCKNQLDVVKSESEAYFGAKGSPPTEVVSGDTITYTLEINHKSPHKKN
ncbi:MAG: hypothetical protein HRO68_06570 [Nitrosopumilus sp.]|nr:hypothetical protein [Nitrosopumilus sp.]